MASSRNDERFLTSLLRTEAVGGLVMLLAAAVAVIWANSSVSGSYESFRAWKLGPLDIEHWASDGALAIFFYLAGLEVKRELLVGSLRHPRDAVVPVVAAACGVAAPVVVYVATNRIGDGDTTGWAIPAATDIAFALAVLSIVGGAMPTSVRAFLLTLAVVDDLIVIAVIAAFYSGSLHWQWLLFALVLLGVFGGLQRFRGEWWGWYVALAPAIWWCVHESGIHATVAGVAMGLLTRTLPDQDEDASPAEEVEHVLQPWSSGLAVPFFALTAAGVHLGGEGLLDNPVAIGAFLGLLLGKPLGIVGGSLLVTKLTRARLDPELSRLDLLGLGLLGGVGFTVALLVADLSYDQASPAKTAVLAASVGAAIVGALVLRLSQRRRAAPDR